MGQGMDRPPVTGGANRMLMALALVVVGLVLLALGGEALLRGAVGLAGRLRLSPAVIGLTVVAAGTSVPELAVSVLASIEGRTDIAVANVVGSNVFNVLFVVGLCSLVRSLTIGGNTIRLEYPVMAIVTLMCLALTQDGTLNRLDALLLLVIYVLFTAYMVTLVRGQMNVAETQEFSAAAEHLATTSARQSLPWLIGLMAAGIGVLAAGAQATVTGAIALATWFGLSERVIGLTIVAAGTSLPEVVTSLVSLVRGRDDVALGNVIGSNIFNILGILGISAAIAPLSVHPTIIASDNWWMLGAAVLLFPVMVTGLRVNRLEGGLMLTLYVAYVAHLLGVSGVETW
jgi:cation:H+ antiporter